MITITDIASNETINCIVNGMIDYKVIKEDDAQQFGSYLSIENIKSFNSRYGEKHEPPTFTFTYKGKGYYTTNQIVGCVRSWQYQTDLYEKFEEGEGWRKTEELLKAILYDLIGDNCPWGLE